MSRVLNMGYGRIPLSDETPDLDDDIIEEEEGTVGAEEQYADLSFETDDTREYEPEYSYFEDDYYDSLEGDDFPPGAE